MYTPRMDDSRLIEMAVEIADGFYGEQLIDWENLLDRLEEWSDTDLGTDLTSPLIRKIQRGVRAARREG